MKLETVFKTIPSWTEGRFVNTRKGKMVVTTGEPSCDFWNLWGHHKDELKSLGFNVYKKQPGGWEVTHWAEWRVAKVKVMESFPMLDCVAPEGLQYYDFQKKDISKLIACGGSGLNANEQGLGKTITSLGLVNQLEGIEKILVVCPSSLKINWKEEAEKWLIDPYHIHIISTRSDTPTLQRNQKQIFIINYELLSHYPEFIRSYEWDYLFLDEAHKIKNPTAQRTREVIGSFSRGIEPIPCKRVMPITGTPILSKPKEIWTLLYLLDPVKWKSWDRFVRRYCDPATAPDYNGATNMEELHKLLQPYMVRHKKRDVLQELPEKVRQTISLNGNKITHRALVYEEATLADCVGRSPAMQFSMIAEARKRTAVAKVPMVIDHVLDTLESNGPLILFAHHHVVIDKIIEELEGKGKRVGEITGTVNNTKRDEAVKKFQNGELDVIIGSIGAMGTGLTLTASSQVIFAELPWTPGELVQAEDRAHRIGQKNAVLIQYIVIENSIDQKITRILKTKAEIVDRVIDGKAPKGLEAGDILKNVMGF